MNHSTFHLFNHSTLAAAVTAVAATAAAVPRVSQNDVLLVQDQQSRLVSVTYTLTGEPAVITVDFQTNAVANAETGWLSIGAVNFTNTTGFVNQVVPVGQHSIWWQPKESWPDKVIAEGKFRAEVTAWATNAPPDYCAVCLLTDAQMNARVNVTSGTIPRRRYFVSAAAVPGGVQDAMYKTEFLLLRKIPAAGVVWRRVYPCWNKDMTTVTPHKVMLTKDYYIGVYEMTIGQHSNIRGTGDTTSLFAQGWVTWNSLRGTYTDYPWPDANTNANPTVASDSAIGQLRTVSGIDSFDLPTEAQWEYACRAGNGGWSYNQTTYIQKVTDTAAQNLLKAVGWFSSNSGNSVHVVGEKPANAWGLYDTLGNVGEWTLNWFGPYPEPSDPNDILLVDPVGPVSNSGNTKTVKGAHFKANTTERGWIGHRDTKTPGTNDSIYGYRVVCDAVAK